jgi:hypothetical protein
VNIVKDGSNFRKAVSLPVEPRADGGGGEVVGREKRAERVMSL